MARQGVSQRRSQQARRRQRLNRRAKKQTGSSGFSERTHQRESLLKKLGLASLTFLLAAVLALLSVNVQRTGPEVVEYGNMCGPNSSDPCYEPELKGGFPIAYLIDAPGVSVEHQLSLGEDDLHPEALALDVALYFAAILGIVWVASHRSSRSRASRSD